MARIILLFLIVIDLNVFSQQTAIFKDPELHYFNGIELLKSQKYGAAQKEFQQVIFSKENISYTTLGNSTFYIAKCASELLPSHGYATQLWYAGGRWLLWQC